MDEYLGNQASYWDGVDDRMVYGWWTPLSIDIPKNKFVTWQQVTKMRQLLEKMGINQEKNHEGRGVYFCDLWFRIEAGRCLPLWKYSADEFYSNWDSNAFGVLLTTIPSLALLCNENEEVTRTMSQGCWGQASEARLAASVYHFLVVWCLIYLLPFAPICKNQDNVLSHIFLLPDIWFLSASLCSYI